MQTFWMPTTVIRTYYPKGYRFDREAKGAFEKIIEKTYWN